MLRGYAGLEQHVWDVDLYGELLEIGGGKERMTKYFKVCGTLSVMWASTIIECMWDVCLLAILLKGIKLYSSSTTLSAHGDSNSCTVCMLDLMHARSMQHACCVAGLAI